MLVRFSSTQTEPLLMFGDIAVQLIKMLGATGNVPGAITAEDLPAAITALRQKLQVLAATKPPAAQAEDDEEEGEHEPPIELAARAAPLLDLLERARAGNAAVMWEAQ